MRIGIYILHDLVAESPASPPQLHRADAAAVRWFQDIAQENKHVGAHLGDFQLVKIGELDQDGSIVDTTRRIILTGDAMVAMAAPQQGGNLQLAAEG